MQIMISAEPRYLYSVISTILEELRSLQGNVRNHLNPLITFKTFNLQCSGHCWLTKIILDH